MRGRLAGAAGALAAAIAIASLAAGATAVDGATARAKWNTRVFAIVPPPGFPARTYVAPDGRVYEGTYDNPLGDPSPSRVLEYTADGTLMRSWTIHGQHRSGAHGVQVASSDARGRLVLLDLNPGRVLILDRRSGSQRTYATFPDLKTCPLGRTQPHCSPALRDEAPFPDYSAWGPDGSLYVTDYNQAVVWRIPPGGGHARVWLSDRRLDGDMFGTAGIALAGDRRTLLVAQASSAGLAEPNPTTGKLYAVPIRRGGRPGPMRRLWESHAADAPDGFAVARSGRIYLALSGPASQLVELAPGGHELERFPKTPLTGSNGSSIAFDTPSSAFFLGTRILVANQSYITGTASHQAILDVETGEPGLREFIPRHAGLPRP